MYQNVCIHDNVNDPRGHELVYVFQLYPMDRCQVFIIFEIITLVVFTIDLYVRIQSAHCSPKFDYSVSCNAFGHLPYTPSQGVGAWPDGQSRRSIEFDAAATVDSYRGVVQHKICGAL